MKVRAKFKANKFGYIHDVRRRNGDEFTIEPREYSEKWMVVIEGQKDDRDWETV